MNPYRTARTPAENFRDREEGSLRRSLDGFVRRFPVSGRIVVALVEEHGSLGEILEAVEAGGHVEHARIWLSEGTPHPLEVEHVRAIFSSNALDRVAESLGIPRESVEVQAAVALPHFFSMLAHEDQDGLDFGYSRNASADAKHAHVDTVAGRVNPGVNPGLKTADIDSDASESA